MPINKQIANADEERLSQLIRLKRSEKPDETFWKRFEEDLRSKQLSALVRTQSWYERLGKLSLLIARRSAAATAAASALALTFVAISHSGWLSADKPEPSKALEVAEVSGATPEMLAPHFDVRETVEASLATPTESLASTFDVPTTYGANVLTQTVSNERFQLVSSPKTLIANDDDSNANSRIQKDDSKYGAKIIRASQEF